MTLNEPEVVPVGGASDPPVTPGSPPEPTSPSPVDVDAIIAALGPKIAESVSKEVQSFKDKRFNQVGQAVSGFAEQLARLESKVEGGLSKEQALEQISLEDRLAALEQTGQTPPSPVPPVRPTGTGKNAAEVAEATKAVLKALGVNENTPEVTKIFAENTTLESQLQAIVALSAAQSPANSPNPAGVMPTGGGAGAFKDAEAIGNELRVLYEKQSTPEIEAQIDKLINDLERLQPAQKV